MLARPACPVTRPNREGLQAQLVGLIFEELPVWRHPGGVAATKLDRCAGALLRGGTALGPVTGP